MAQKKLSKNDLIDIVYQNTNCEKKVVQQVVDSFISELKNTILNRSAVEIRGLGIFEARLKKASTARNPRTGAAIEIPAHYTAGFRLGSEFKNALKEIKVSE